MCSSRSCSTARTPSRQRCTAPAWQEGVRRLLHELDEHMYKEDFGLFPAAIATLDGSDWDAMDNWEETHAARA